MFTATDAACALLSQMLAESNAPDDMAVRFVIQENDLSLKLDRENPGDATFPHEGRTVLLVDQDISQVLSGKTLDVKDTAEGPQFTLS